VELEQAVRGDLVHVEQMPRNRPVVIPQNTREVLVVRWELGGACEMIPAFEPLSRGQRAVYHGVLRPRELWRGATPTIDMFASYKVPVSVDNASQHFAMIDSLPGDSLIRANPREALARTQLWRAARTRDSSTYDSESLYRELRRASRDALAAQQRTEISGTYRLTLASETRDTSHVFLRIAAQPMRAGYLDSIHAWHVQGLQDLATSNDELAAPLLVLSVTSGDSILSLFGEPGVPRFRNTEGRVTVTSRAREAANGAKTWRASLDVLLFDRLELEQHRRTRNTFASLSPVLYPADAGTPPQMLMLPRNATRLRIDRLEVVAAPDGSVSIMPTSGFRGRVDSAIDRSEVRIIAGERISTRSFHE
jgi:hypothetical protein